MSLGQADRETAVATELQLDLPTQGGKSWLSVEGIVQDASKSRVTRSSFSLTRGR